MGNLKLVFGCLLFLKVGLLFGISFNQLTVSQGLSSNIVTCQYIDNRGILWVGTSNGLNEYNGIDFYTYLANSDNEQSLVNNFITCIDEDEHGNIWVGTHNGLCCFDIRNRVFIQPKLLNKHLSGEVVKNLIADNSSIIWINTNTHIIAYNTKNSRIETFKMPRNNDTDKCINIISNGKGNILCQQHGKVFEYFHNTDRITEYASLNKVIEQYEADLGNYQLLKAINDTVWIYSKQHVFQYIPNASRLQQLVPDIAFQEVYNTSAGVFLLNSNALYTFNNTNNHFSEILGNQLITKGVNSVAYNGKNTVYIGTNKGLLQYSSYQQVFYNSLASNYVPGKINTLVADENTLYIGCNKGLYIQNERGVHQVGELKNTKVTDLLLINKTLYCATQRGVYIYSSTGRNVVNISELLLPGNKINLLNDQTYCLAADSNSGILYFSNSNGLFSYNIHTKALVEFQHYFDNTDTIGFDNVNDILVSHNTIYLATTEGLTVFNKSEKLFETYTITQNHAERINNNITTIKSDANGLLWLGTPYGLYSFHEKNKNFTRYCTNNGLTNNHVLAIETDTLQNVWFTTQSGISRVNQVTGIVNNYLPFKNENAQYYSVNASYSANGNIYFGGSSIVYFNPYIIDRTETIPGVNVRNIKIYHENSIENIYRYSRDTLRLNFNYNNLLVELFPDDLSYTEATKFRYTMQSHNQQKDWENAHLGNVLIIPRQQPGIYTLKVQVSGSYGSWSPKMYVLYLKINGPIWKSKWAYMAYIILFLLLVYMFFMYRTRKLRASNRNYRERERIAREIEKQKEALAMQNKNIKASINYAKRIQQAMMPSERLFASILPNSFILHIPKDIVSGDFYWVNQDDNLTYVASVDCTGHGVPGAFMSIIGIELFRKITKIHGIKKPADILDRLNEDFAAIFKDVSNITLRDGMDVALCVIDKANKKIQYAGAFNPLYIIRDNKIIEIKADRFSVGLDESDFGKQRFHNNELDYLENDMIYLFSDGYADQFGGPEGKKFKYRRFRHLLLTYHQLSLDKQKEYLHKSIMEWKGDLDQVDDILLMGIKL